MAPGLTQSAQQATEAWAVYVNSTGGLRVGGQAYGVEIRYADDESNPQLTAKQLESPGKRPAIAGLAGHRHGRIASPLVQANIHAGFQKDQECK